MKKDSYYQELEKEGYYNTIDKRSKDYREYKQWMNTQEVKSNYEEFSKNIEEESKGLGDTIAKVTKATGIEKIVKFVSGDDCGCNERKKMLNEKFRYKTVNCISEEDYIWASDFINKKTTKITSSQQVRFNKIHNYIFGTNKSISSCPSCVKKTIENIKRYLDTYN